VVRAALTEYGVHWDPIEVRLHGEQFQCGGNGMAAVDRRTLLRLLQQRALAVGVDLRFSSEFEPADVFSSGADLVVAADGANSRIRERFSDVFAPTVDTATAKFIWLGTSYPFKGLTFVHERGPHGVFAVHGYPIGNGVSTFIVETDELSWRAAGLDEFDVSAPPGLSDEKSRCYLQRLFADEIDGHRLIANNSRWGNFRTYRAGRWHHTIGNTQIVLLGDSAHTAHFSVGSGTKMAMEDAVALAHAIDADRTDLASALDHYEADRRPGVAKIQNSARPSLSWWEHFGRSHDRLPSWQFAYHFFTRALSESRLRLRDSAFVDRTHACWRAAYGSEPLESPCDVAGHHLSGRVVRVTGDTMYVDGMRLPLRRDAPSVDGAWGLVVDAPDSEAGLPAAIEAAAGGIQSGASLVLVRGGTRLTRRLLTESARLDHHAVTVLADDLPTGQGDIDATDIAVTAVLSGRADLVVASPDLPRSRP
jgi:anthraniloyl-CoA monooxygenase